MPGGAEMSEAKLPLAGMRVLDAATFLAGPFCAAIFSEFGAEVIKIEHPDYPDPMRNIGMKAETGDSLTFLSEGRNKKPVTLNLGKPEGAELFRQLVAKCDVVIENFRPGTMEKWGLGYKELAAIKPDIVMVRITAYGQDGPYKDRPGFARIGHAFSGLTYLAGEPDGPPVIPGSTSLGDYISGLYGALGALMALRHRDRTGEGQYIDVALYESTFRMLDELAPAFAKFGVVRQRMGADTATIVPHSHYQCGDGQWVAIACSSDKIFEKLALAMGRADLVAPGSYETMQARVDNRDFINGIVSSWIGSKTRDELMAICLDKDIPCGPVNSIADIFADPHFAARGSMTSVPHPEVGEVVIPSVLPRLSKTPGRIEHLGRRHGENTEDVYRELLGLTAERLAELKARGVI
jgi:crotonobetainyl-CoA:carnitine CoA-transferase CaiB-like acyl-CoA transferase